MAHKTGTLNEAQARLEHKMAVNRDYIFQPRMCKYFYSYLCHWSVLQDQELRLATNFFQLQPTGLSLVLMVHWLFWMMSSSQSMLKL